MNAQPSSHQLSRRRFFRLAGGALAATSAASLLAACEPTDKPTPTPVPTRVAHGLQDRPTPVPLVSAAGPVSLRVATATYAQGPARQALDHMVAVFRTDNPSVSIDIESAPDMATLAQRLESEFSAGDPPDIFLLETGWAEAFAARGQLLVLDSYVKPGQLGDYYQGLQPSGTWKGNLLGLPLQANTTLLLYRKDLFAAAGLDPEQPPTTWDELADYATRLTRRDQRGSLTQAGFDLLGGVSTPAQQPRQHFFRFYWQNGAQLFAGPDTQAAFTSPEATEAFEWFVSLVRDRKVMDLAFGGNQPGPNPLLDGRAAMGSYPSTVWRSIQQQPDLARKIGVVPLLVRKQRAEWATADMAMIARQTRYPAEAWAFFEYLTGQEAMTTASVALDAIPARKSLRVSDYVKGDPLLSIATEVLQYAHSEGGPTRWPEIAPLWDHAIIDALQGKAMPRAILAELSRQADDILARPA